MMRIAYVGDMTSIHMRRWAGVFAGMGHDVHVITTKPYSDPAPAGITVHDLIAPRSAIPQLAQLYVAANLPRMISRLRRQLGSIAPDVVHVHYLNEAALWAVRASSVPVVVTAWGSDIVVAPQKSRLRRWAAQYVLRHAELVTCDAEHMRTRIEALGAMPNKVHVLFFGTDVTRYQPACRSAALRRRYGAETAPLIVSIRSLEPVYDIPTYLDAIPAVLKRHPTAKFLVAGRGNLADALRAHAEGLGVGDSVQFIGGVSQDELPALLASSDVYVSTALSDGGLAASTAEAMAAGTAVAISHVSDNADWVANDRTGALFPPKDANALADVLVDLIAHPEKRSRLGAAGREVIVERNNLYVEMAKMERLYESVRRGGTGASREPIGRAATQSE